MEIGLLNWTPDKGNPYDYSVFNAPKTYSFSDNKIIISEKKLRKMKEKMRIRFNHRLALLATLTCEQAHLMHGIYKNDGFNFLEKKELNYEKEVTLFLSYPFKKQIEVIINPMLITRKDKSIHNSNIGYYAWQIANAYAEIYKNHWEEVGVWGHGFGDLFLEGIIIMEKNNLLVSIGS
jgi:hypothetical protein